MWFSPSLFLFFLSVLSSIFLVSSSPSPFISWVGLELNTLAFIPLLMSLKGKLVSESSIKYFLTQTLASILFVFSAMLMILLGEGTIFLIFFLVSLSIKLGAAPFHSWVMSIADSCPWIILFILLTVQKINPLLILGGGITSYTEGYMLIVIVSVLVGGLLGLIQTSVRLLITYSSINHVGWLMMSLLYDLRITIIYFGIYILILSPLVEIFKKFNIAHINQLVSMNFKLKNKLMIFILFLSLGGLPPFLGFLPKWLVLQHVIYSGMILLGSIMVFISLFTLFYYLRIGFSAMIFNSNVFMLNENKDYLSKWNSLSVAFSLMGLSLIYIC